MGHWCWHFGTVKKYNLLIKCGVKKIISVFSCVYSQNVPICLVKNCYLILRLLPLKKCAQHSLPIVWHSGTNIWFTKQIWMLVGVDDTVEFLFWTDKTQTYYAPHTMRTKVLKQTSNIQWAQALFFFSFFSAPPSAVIYSLQCHLQ